MGYRRFYCISCPGTLSRSVFPSSRHHRYGQAFTDASTQLEATWDSFVSFVICSECREQGPYSCLLSQYLSFSLFPASPKGWLLCINHFFLFLQSSIILFIFTKVSTPYLHCIVPHLSLQDVKWPGQWIKRFGSLLKRGVSSIDIWCKNGALRGPNYFLYLEKKVAGITLFSQVLLIAINKPKRGSGFPWIFSKACPIVGCNIVSI